MWRDEKQRWEESERREMSRREKEKESEEEGEEDTGVRNVGKFAKLYVCPMICRSGGSKSRLAKSDGRGAIWPHEK